MGGKVGVDDHCAKPSQYAGDLSLACPDASGKPYHYHSGAALRSWQHPTFWQRAISRVNSVYSHSHLSEALLACPCLSRIHFHGLGQLRAPGGLFDSLRTRLRSSRLVDPSGGLSPALPEGQSD